MAISRMGMDAPINARLNLITHVVVLLLFVFTVDVGMERFKQDNNAMTITRRMEMVVIDFVKLNLHIHVKANHQNAKRNKKKIME